MSPVVPAKATFYFKLMNWAPIEQAINQQIHRHNVTVTLGYHIDASITHSPRKSRNKPTYEVVNDREERDDEPAAQQNMQVVEVTQPGVDTEARWVKKGGRSVFGYKQYTLVDDNGLVVAMETTAANQHDSQPMLDVLDKEQIKTGSRLHEDKAAKNKPLTRRQSQRNRLITQFRYVVERTFGSRARWFNSKILRYVGLAKAHAWHTLLAMAYNLKRLPKLYALSLIRQDKCAF